MKKERRKGDKATGQGERRMLKEVRNMGEEESKDGSREETEKMEKTKTKKDAKKGKKKKR